MPIKDISVKVPQLFYCEVPLFKILYTYIPVLQPFCGKAVSHFTFYYRCMCLCFRVSLY